MVNRILILFSILFSQFLSAQSLTFEGTLFDSNSEPIQEANTKIRIKIFDQGVTCVLYEREYILDLSSSNGHFSVDLSQGTVVAGFHSGNTLTSALSNANGNSVTCADNSTRNFDGSYVERQVRLSILEVAGVDINDIDLPLQKLQFTPFANEAETAKSFTGSISGDVEGTSSASVVTGIRGVTVDASAPSDGQVLKYDNASGKYVPSIIDSAAIGDNSVSVDDLDFASSEGISIPTQAAAPGSPSAGQIYYNSVDNKVYFYNGSGWVDTGAGGGDFQSDGSIPLTGSLQLNGNYLSGDGDAEGIFVSNSGEVGIGTTSPSSKLDLKGSAASLTIGDSRDQSWTIGDALGGINFASDDTSSGGTLDKVRARIGAYAGDSFGASHGLSFQTTDIVDGVLREQATIDSRGVLSVGITRRDQTNLKIYSNSTGSPVYGLELADTYAGTAPNHILFSSMDSVGATRLSSAAIGSTASGKSGAGQMEGSLDFLTKGSADGSPVQRMIIDSSGNVGIGTTSPTEKLDVAGCIKHNNGTLGSSCSSDRRLKKDIEDNIYEDALDKISLLRPRKYRYLRGNQNIYLGVIAQELQEIAPELVMTKDDGYLAVDYEGLKWMSYEAIAELNRKLREESAAKDRKIESLENSLKALLERVEKLEAKNP